jgi:hypothetical protein
MKVVCDMSHIGKNEGEFYINKCKTQKMRESTFK